MATAQTVVATPALTAVAYAAMFVFGIVIAIVGAIAPVLSERLAFTLGQVGTLFFVMNLAMLTASLLAGLIVDRIGLRWPLALGAWLVAVGVASIAGADHYSTLLPAVAALGFGGGALNNASNTLVADLFDEPVRKAAALNRLGVFYGFGALTLPFCLGALMTAFGLAGLLNATAALCAVAGLAALAPSFPAPKQLQGWPLARLPQFIGEPLVVALAALLFFESGNEFLLGGYIATLLTREMALTTQGASYALAGFWAAIMIGRLAMGGVLQRVSASTTVLVSAGVAAATTLALAVAPQAGVAVPAAVLTGAAFAAIFPTVLSVAGSRFPSDSGAVFGVLFTAALTGGMTMPWVAGHVADTTGVRAVFVLAAANFAAVAVLSQRWRR